MELTLEEAIAARHSVRRYTARQIEGEKLARLLGLIEECNASGQLNLQLVTGEPRAFGGFASYGTFEGVSNYVVVAGRRGPTLEEHAGHEGERIVLLAQKMGLNSCWVGMTYKKVGGAFSLREGDKLLCVIALGYGAESGKAHKVKRPDQVSRSAASAPEWFGRGLKSALLAPTGMNRQKFRLEWTNRQTPDGRPIVKARTRFSFVNLVNLDMGIVKLHFEIGAGREIAWE